MSELFKTLFGNYTCIQMLGYLWFFIIGYVIYGLSEVSGRNVYSPKTPRKWSYKFWFLDNWRRYVTTLLSTYIIFRFYIEICGHELSYMEVMMLGLLGDGVSKKLKDRVSIISANREELMKQHNQEDIG